MSQNQNIISSSAEKTIPPAGAAWSRGERREQQIGEKATNIRSERRRPTTARRGTRPDIWRSSRRSGRGCLKTGCVAHEFHGGAAEFTDDHEFRVRAIADCGLRVGETGGGRDGGAVDEGGVRIDVVGRCRRQLHRRKDRHDGTTRLRTTEQDGTGSGPSRSCPSVPGGVDGTVVI